MAQQRRRLMSKSEQVALKIALARRLETGSEVPNCFIGPMLERLLQGKSFQVARDLASKRVFAILDVNADTDFGGYLQASHLLVIYFKFGAQVEFVFAEAVSFQGDEFNTFRAISGHTEMLYRFNGQDVRVEIFSMKTK